MNYKRLLLVVLLIGITAVIAACSGSQETQTITVTRVVTESEEPATVEDAAESIPEPPLSTGSEGVGDEPPAPETGEKVQVTRIASELTAVEGSSSAEVVRADGEAALAASGAETASTTSEIAAESNPDRITSTGISDTSLSPNQNSHLTAGEVDDNAQWNDYLQYLRRYQGASIIPVDVSDRHQIWVKDSQGNPVLGALIEVEADGQLVTKLRTHSNGRSLFFPRAYQNSSQDYIVYITVNNQTEAFTIPAQTSQREWFITHPGADQRQQPQTQLDVLFLIDATGSMADEINQLKENIRAISAQIDAMPSRPNVHFGMVTYRDQGDQYLTQVTDFTPYVEDFAADLDRVRADGGGDYPEDLNEALTQAIHRPEWRVEDTVSLVFLVADAPPHLDYGQQNDYAYEMLQAATLGIKIYPIASSGLDEQGEYIYRQLAQTTGGRFIFLTYGEGGPGTTGTETEFEVNDYTVSSLDDMVIQIVEEELAPLNR